MSKVIEKLLELSKHNDISVMDKYETDVTNKKIYTGEDDDEVLNCEVKPWNFVYDDKTKEKDKKIYINSNNYCY